MHSSGYPHRRDNAGKQLSARAQTCVLGKFMKNLDDSDFAVREKASKILKDHLGKRVLFG
jgi:hypothetical protein